MTLRDIVMIIQSGAIDFSLHCRLQGTSAPLFLGQVDTEKNPPSGRNRQTLFSATMTKGLP